MDGTNLGRNADAKGQSGGRSAMMGRRKISFGLHGDRYRLENPVYASSVWYAGRSSTGNWSALDDGGSARTRTEALWLQDAWKIAPNLKLTLGGRLESWQGAGWIPISIPTLRAGPATPANPINPLSFQFQRISPA